MIDRNIQKQDQGSGRALLFRFSILLALLFIFSPFGGSDKTLPSLFSISEAYGVETSTSIITTWWFSGYKSSWTVPSDWNSASNTIELVGAGGSTNDWGGGGGGAYARISNLSLTPGSVIDIFVTSAGAATTTDTWFNGTTCATASACAKGGSIATSTLGAMGGAASSSVGTIRYSGGKGGTGSATVSTGGGGGGAAGPGGNGKNGGNGDTNASGRNGGGGGGGAGGGLSTAGSNGGTTGGTGGDGPTGNPGGTGASATGGCSTNDVVGTGGGGGGGSAGTYGTNGCSGQDGIEWVSDYAGGNSRGAGGGGAGGGNDGVTFLTLGGRGGAYGGGGAGFEGWGAQGLIFITYTLGTLPPPNLTQIHYRWRNDNGTEVTATWAAAENTPIGNVATGTAKRLRFEVSNEGTGTSTAINYRLEYATSTGASIWTPVGSSSASTNHWVMIPSQLVEGNNTTDVASGLTNENTTFVAGRQLETSNESAGITLGTTNFTELEYAITPTSTAIAGQTYYFRLTNAGTSTNFTYTRYASATIAGIPNLTQIHYRWRSDNGAEPASGGSWTNAGDANWVARTSFAAAVHDNKMWIMGGNADNNCPGYACDDVWYSADGASWTRATQAPGWSERVGLSAVSYNGKLWVMGGNAAFETNCVGSTSTYCNDVWSSVDGTSWNLVTNSAEWSPRAFSKTLVYNDKMWLIGGVQPTGNCNGSGSTACRDVWYSTSGISWTLATSTAAYGEKSYFAAVVHDSKMWVMGGSVGSGYSNAVYYSTSGIVWTSAGSPGWAARSTFDGVGDYDGKMWIMGGINSNQNPCDGVELCNDVWYSTSGTAWSQATGGAEWAKRYGHKALALNGKLWVMGGFSYNAGCGAPMCHDVWYSNDVGATFSVAEDTPTTTAKYAPLRLRMEVSNEGTGTATSSATAYRLEYSTSTTGGWAQVGTSSASTAHWVMKNSTYITDGASTTDVSGGLTNENTTFKAGQIKDTGNQTAAIALGTANFTEVEYSITATSTAIDGMTYYFRLTDAGTALTTYTRYASATVAAAAGVPNLTQIHYRWRNDDGGEGAPGGGSSTSSIIAHPIDGTESYTAWTMNAGCTENTTEYDCMNDQTANAATGTAEANDGDTSNLRATGAARSSFHLANGMIPTGATVTDIIFTIAGAEVSGAGGNATVTGFYRLNSSDTDCGTAGSFGGTTYTTQSCTISGLSLTPTDIDNMEIGISYGANDPKVSQVYVELIYAESAGGGGATWAADQDTPTSSLAKQTPIRLRIEVSNEGTGDATSGSAFRLEYATSTGASTWTQVGTTSASTAHWVMAASANFTDGDATTDVTNGLTNENTTFDAGQIKDTGNQTAGITLASTEFTEIEYSIAATTTAIASQTYYFRVTNAGTAINTYTIYASATVAAAAAGNPNLTQIHYRWRNDEVATDNLIFINTTASTTWTVPSDWNNSSNSIEVIAGGGGGRAAATGAAGGGGGAYSFVSNVTLTAGASVAIAVGAGGTAGVDGGDTYLCNALTNCASATGTAVQVAAKGGTGATGSASAPGGASSTGVGTIRYAGGAGGTGTTSGGNGGGGGAAAPGGDGKNGGDGDSTTAADDGGGGGGGAGGASSTPGTAGTTSGGAGGDGRLGTGGGAGGVGGGGGGAGFGTGGGGGGGDNGNNGAPGGSGSDWVLTGDLSSTHGAGGGGGAAGNSGAFGNTGGKYGGGSGGGTSVGDAGDGVIVIRYTSASTWAAAEDQPITDVAKQTTKRLRFEVSNEGTGDATSTSAFRLEYATSTGASTWTQVGAGNHWIMSDSANITDGASTTDDSGITNENTSFNAGQIKDTGNQTAGILLSSTEFTELEYSIQADTIALDSTTYYFRLTKAGTALNTYTRYASATIAATFTPANLTQIHYRWRNNDGTEPGATWAAGADTPISSVSKQTIQRLRFEVSNEGGTSSAATAYRIEYATSTGASVWTPVGSSSASTNHWVMIPSQLIEGNDTTDVAGGLNNENTSFVAGKQLEVSNESAAITLSSSSFTEVEYSIAASSTAIDGTTYYFRLTNGGTALTTYATYASATVIVAGPAGPASGTLISQIFDTQRVTGSALNSIIWQGYQPAGTVVEFQIAAASSSAGPWQYRGPSCTTSAADVYDTGGPNLPMAVSKTCHNNMRYFRYKIILQTDADRLYSPRVDSITLNWSP